MEASRSDPVDLKYFTVIETKASVLSEVGNPVATTPDGTNSCDIYKFYARGPEATGKAAIATGEIVADVFTLGLTEVVFAPVEAATKNNKHTVVFCYDQNNNLVSLNESDTHVDH